MNAVNMLGLADRVTHGTGCRVRVPHELHRDQLRRRAGRAYVRLQGACGEIARVIGLKSHSSISRRRKGEEGPLPALLIEIDALERAGIRTDEIMLAILQTQMEARQADEPACVQTIVMEEQEADAKEDLAQTAFLTGKASGKEWVDALEAYVLRILQRLPALRKAVA